MVHSNLQALTTKVNCYNICAEKNCFWDRTRDISQKKILGVTAAVRLVNREYLMVPRQNIRAVGSDELAT